MLLTCGVDGYAKVWDMGTGIAAPKLVGLTVVTHLS